MSRQHELLPADSKLEHLQHGRMETFTRGAV